MFTRDRAWGIVLALFVLLIGFGCGAANRPLPRAHWPADADGTIRVTYRFPSPLDATNIRQGSILASDYPENWKAITRQRLADWKASAARDGIRFEFTEVPPTDRAAKVDFVVALTAQRLAGECFTWSPNEPTGELGRAVIVLRPDLPEELVSGTVAHEQGHMLGLPEIDNDRALMSHSRPNATITGSDTAELLRHYPRTIQPL